MYIAHQPFGFPQLTVADGFGDDHKNIVNFVVEILWTQSAIQEEPDASGKHLVEFFHCGRISVADAFHQIRPIGTALDVRFRD